jgi:hypothetical protein
VGTEPVGVIAIGAAPTGVIAIGQLATGVIAIGQLARGFVTVGQLSIGVAAFGQLAVGITWASGQLALGMLTGAALVPVSPFGRFHPFRKGPEKGLIRLPSTRPGWVGTIVFVIVLAVVVSLVSIGPVWDAIIRQGGIFRS